MRNEFAALYLSTFPIENKLMFRFQEVILDLFLTVSVKHAEYRVLQIVQHSFETIQI